MKFINGVASALSIIFSPLLMATYGVALAMVLSFLCFIPTATKLTVILETFLATTAIPVIGIFILSRLKVISDPKLLILDEPANFVDNKFENELYRTLRELNSRMAIVMVSHDIGTITSVVKESVCVNRRVHRHHSNVITEEQLRNYDCPIQIVSHGHIPHTVLEHHPGDCCCDHD